MYVTNYKKNNGIYFKQVNTKTKLNLYIFLLSFCFLSFSLITIFKIVGYAAFVVLVIISFLYLLNSFLYQKLNIKLFFLFLIFALLRIINFNVQSFSYLAQLIIIVAILFYIPRNQINKQHFFGFNLIYSIIILFAIADFFLNKDVELFYFFGSTNTFAGTFYVLFIVNLVILFHQKKLWYIINNIISIFFIYLLDSRTPLLVLIVIFFAYFIIKHLCKTRLRANIFFILLTILMITAIFIYTNIKSMPFYNFLNSLSITIFGKNIDSGRPEIWKLMFETVGNNFLFGVGNIEEQILIGKSAHNQFIQIYVENGLMGLGLVLLILLIIWKQYSKYCYDKIVCICMSCLIGIIVYNCFEVSLFQNKFVLGCFQWTVLAIGLGRVNQLSKNKQNTIIKKIGNKYG